MEIVINKNNIYGDEKEVIKITDKGIYYEKSVEFQKAFAGCFADYNRFFAYVLQAFNLAYMRAYGR